MMIVPPARQSTHQPKDHRSRIQSVAQLAGEAELGALVLRIFDELEDGLVEPANLGDLQRYQLGLLAGFLESAKRGSLDDVKELAMAHAAAVTSEHPTARQPTLDDDESRWSLLLDLNGGNEHVGRQLIDDGIAVVDALRNGDGSELKSEFVTDHLVPFLDRLAHVDERIAETEIDGYHSLHG